MYRKTVLDNSVRIVTETLPSRTVSVGIWINTGSRDEDETNNGCAHFVEHMLFKGTANRTARRISMELDRLGGMSNAFTSTEHTCLYATVLDSHLGQAVELLADLFLNSRFPPDEIDSECQVILQEIAMVEDTPDDKVHEIFSSLVWPDHPLGFTVLGSPDVVSGMTAGVLKEYMRKQYLAGRVTVVAAGRVEHEMFVDLWRAKLAELPVSPEPWQRCPPQIVSPSSIVVNKPLEQVHLVLGGRGLPIVSEDRYALLLLNTILGGNMSSRLYQEIRERRGLAYSVYSYLVSYSDSGYCGIYLGVDPQSLVTVIELVKNELNHLISAPVTDEELSRAVDYARGGMYLAAENMETRMIRLGRNELYFNRDISIDEVSERLGAVEPVDLNAVAETLFQGGPGHLSVVGPVDENITRDVVL